MVKLLDVDDVAFDYPRRRTVLPALDGVTFAADEGQLVFLLGPNGSGKSTLFRLVLGLLKPTAGQVRVGGEVTTEVPARTLARRVAYVPQNENLAFDYTAREIVLMGRTPHLARFSQQPGSDDEAATDEALAVLGIEHLAHVGIRSMSGGERQLVILARALCQGSRVLILDEPTSALDLGNQTVVLRHLRALAERGYLLVVSSHNPMHALAHADRMLLLKAGRLVADVTPDSVTEAHLSDLYDTPLRLLSTREDPSLRICVPVEPPEGVLDAPSVR